MLRAAELGISQEELDQMTIGMVFDMLTEKSNDDYDYPLKATQQDFDNF